MRARKLSTFDPSRPMRLRSRALWAFSMAAACLVAAGVGLAQYMQSGVVAIRPGHAPVAGAAALESLLALVIVGVLFAAGGAALRACAARHHGTRPDRRTF